MSNEKSMEFGDIEKLGFDEFGWEKRRRYDDLVCCDNCYADVPLFSITSEWIASEGTYFQHVGFGRAEGLCDSCQLLYVATKKSYITIDVAKKEVYQGGDRERAYRREASRDYLRDHKKIGVRLVDGRQSPE